MNEKELLTAVIPIRLTATEAAVIKAKASADQRPTSQWLRLEVLRSIGSLPQREPEVSR